VGVLGVVLARKEQKVAESAVFRGYTH